jgi:hypothetical protein
MRQFDDGSVIAVMYLKQACFERSAADGALTSSPGLSGQPSTTASGRVSQMTRLV